MHKLKFLTISIILVMLISLAGPLFDVSARPLAAISPILGASGSYSVLAGSTVTNTGQTTTNGNVGVAPGTAITGFPPGAAIHSNDASAIAAQADNLIVFGTLDQTCDQTFGAVDLTTTFPTGVGPGVYCSTSSFSLTGNLNLIGSGVWIFKTVSTLITSPGSSVTGGDPCNVWWRVGSFATLNTTTSFIGSVFALTAITVNSGAILNGRVLAQTGQVTLQSDTITGPICAAQATSTPTVTQPATTPTITQPATTPTVTQPATTPTVTQPATTPTVTQPATTPTVTQPATTPTVTQPATTPTVTATTAGTATPTATPVPPTAKPAQPTATHLPVITALPGTGGAPIQNEDFPWSLVIAGGFSAIALFLGIRAYRNAYRPK